MICPCCSTPDKYIRLPTWTLMRQHIVKQHPKIDRPDKLFTREARERNP